MVTKESIYTYDHELFSTDEYIFDQQVTNRKLFILNKFDIISKNGFIGPSFTFKNRFKRFIWKLSWYLFAIWTPTPSHSWRIFILKIFGAKIAWNASIHPSTNIWAPWNLSVGEFAMLGSGVNCYNIAPIQIGNHAVISQNAYLCTGTHSYKEADFQLTARPITIGERAWICANTFVGPGVVIGNGSVLSAGSSAYSNLDAWKIYAGIPAIFYKSRPILII